MSCGFSLIFPFSFTILCITLKIVYLALISLQNMWVQFSSVMFGYPNLSTSQLGHCAFLCIILVCTVLFMDRHSVPLVCMFICRRVSRCFYYDGFAIDFEIEYMVSRFYHLSQDCFDYLRFSQTYWNFRIVLYLYNIYYLYFDRNLIKFV